jgi:hypothetical protein
MNSYGYNIYVKKFIKTYLIGFREKESFSGELLYLLELPLAIFLYCFDISIWRILFSLFAGGWLIFLVILIYNKMVKNLFGKVLLCKTKDKETVIADINRFLKKHEDGRHIYQQRNQYLRQAETCLFEKMDHLV